MTKETANAEVAPERLTRFALERLPFVMARVGLSRSEIYRRLAASPPTFPQPVRIGERAVAFVSTEIDRWLADRIAERDMKRAA